jgi:hypothetical protein
VVVCFTSSLIVQKDSCWWTKKVDTIPTDFVITVDENNFVKKQRTDFIVHKYEVKDCSLFHIYGLWNQLIRNDIYLLDGEPVEVILYKQKGENRNLIIGNSK